MHKYLRAFKGFMGLETGGGDQTLGDFMAHLRASGQTDEQIQLALLEKGWSYADVKSIMKGETE